jgi:hypothetical protein
MNEMRNQAQNAHSNQAHAQEELEKLKSVDLPYPVFVCPPPPPCRAVPRLALP